MTKTNVLEYIGRIFHMIFNILYVLMLVGIVAAFPRSFLCSSCGRLFVLLLGTSNLLDCYVLKGE